MEMVEAETKMKMEVRRETEMAGEEEKEKKMVKKKTYTCNFKENTCQKMNGGRANCLPSHENC